MLNRIKTATVVAFTAATLTSFATAARAGDPEGDAKRLYEQALAHIEKGNWEAAEGKLVRATGLVQKPEYLTELCHVYDVRYTEKKGYLDPIEGAIETCESAVEASSGKLKKRAEKYLASLRDIGRTEKAANKARDGEYRADAGQWDIAEQKYEEAVKLDPKAEYMVGLCKAYMNNGKASKARSTCKKARKKTKDKTLRKEIDGLLDGIAEAAASAPSADQATLLDEVYDAVRRLDFVDLGDNMQSHEIENHLKTAEPCVKGVAGLLASGMKKSDKIVVHHKQVPNAKWNDKLDPPAYEATLGDVQAYCAMYDAGLRVNAARPALQKALSTISIVNNLAQSSPSAGVIASFRLSLDECTAAVDAALATGVSKKTKVEVNGTSYEIGKAGDEVCGALAAALDAAEEAMTDRAEAELAEKLAPYEKVLKGDKLSLVKERKLYNIYVMGKGGTTLSTPKQMAKASLWFELTTSDNDTQWHLTRYQFKGNKLVKTSHSSGKGSAPKAKEYR